jgi:hypothetical protein
MSDQIEETDKSGRDGPRCEQRFVRWKLVAWEDEPFQWELLRTDGTSAATVWENGVWHTWRHDGSGGENSAQDTVSNAMIAAMLAAINQGILSPNVEVMREGASEE